MATMGTVTLTLDSSGSSTVASISYGVTFTPGEVTSGPAYVESFWLRGADGGPVGPHRRPGPGDLNIALATGRTFRPTSTSMTRTLNFVVTTSSLAEDPDPAPVTLLVPSPGGWRTLTLTASPDMDEIYARVLVEPFTAGVTAADGGSNVVVGSFG